MSSPGGGTWRASPGAFCFARLCGAPQCLHRRTQGDEADDRRHAIRGAALVVGALDALKTLLPGTGGFAF